MPTKYNRARQQQPYVPAGNGDESGEYRDNAYGGNSTEIEGKNFSTPKIENKPKQNNIELKVDKNNKKSSFKDYVMSMYGDGEKLGEFGTALVNNFDKGNDESKKIVDFVTKNVGVQVRSTNEISNYDGGSVNLSGISRFGEYSSKVEGETFYHEFWHCFDHRLADKITNKETGEVIYEGLRTQEDTKHIVSSLGGGWEAMVDGAILTRNLSTSKVLSNGKTLYETIQAEARGMSRNGVWSQLQKDYRNEIDDELTKEFPTWKEDTMKLNELSNTARLEAEKLYPAWSGNSFNQGYYENRNKYINEYLDKHGASELKERQSKFNIARSKIEARLGRSWMSISDMYGIYKKVPYGFCGGHIGSYSKNKGAIAREFMAEYGSASSRTDEFAQKELQIFHKYMPESAKMCKELVDMIKNSIKG